MINSNSEYQYFYKSLRSFIYFKIRVFFNFCVNGHIIKKIKISNYLSNKKFKEKKLHLSSSYNLNGYLNSQILGNVPIDITKKLPFKSNTLDLIYSSHLVEHIHYKQIIFFVNECKRVLKKNGKLIIATPSLEKITKISYGENNKNKKILFSRQAKWIKNEFISSSFQINLLMRNFGHRYILDFDFIKKISNNLGFDKVEIIDNFCHFEKELSEYLLLKKPEVWNIETDTYLLVK